MKWNLQNFHLTSSSSAQSWTATCNSIRWYFISMNCSQLSQLHPMKLLRGCMDYFSIAFKAALKKNNSWSFSTRCLITGRLGIIVLITETNKLILFVATWDYRLLRESWVAFILRNSTSFKILDVINQQKCHLTFYLCLFKTFWGAANDTSAMSLSLEMFL